jgi:hypothetical protein
MKDGLMPCPLHPRSKRPSAGEGWNQLVITPSTVDDHFGESDNVGVLLGQPSDWIVDVDLDWDEAVRAAARLLPKTKILGRESRPRSHYFYRCINSKTGKWLAPPPDGSCIVELRSTGSQTVLPPSRHPDGDRYQVDDDFAYAEVSPRSLERLLNGVASAALLARSYPTEGARHDYIHAVAGTLLNLNWDDDRVTDFCWAVLDAAEDDDRAQRERTIANTVKSHKEGGRVYGFKKLCEWLEPNVRDRLSRWLERDARFSVNFKVPDVVLPNAMPIVSSRLLEVPGLVGDIAKWAGLRAYVKQPLFDIAAGLTSVALLSGNRYLVDVWDTPLQPYIMILAPTACGKESALNSVAEFARRVDLNDTIFQGFQSYHAMLDQLLKPPNIACWLWDEAGRKLRQAGKGFGSPESQVVTWLLSLYGRANSYSPAFPGRQQTIPKIDFPFLITLAASQPGVLVDAITASDLSTGLINRFILIDAGDSPPDDNFGRKDLFPSKIHEQARRFVEVQPEEQFLKIRFGTNATYNLFKDFQIESRKRAAQEGTNEMWGRATQNSLILAGIIAVGVDPKKPEIDEKMGEWAIDFCRWSFNQWSMRLGELGNRTRVSEHSKQVERIINNPRAYLDRFRNRKNLAGLLELGLMPRSVLTRLTRHLASRELDEVLKTLVEAELIENGEKNNCEVYWAKG